MALRRRQRQEFRLGAACAQAIGDLLLLLQREQDVGFHADGQRPVDADLRQPVGDVAVPYSAMSNQSIERLR